MAEKNARPASKSADQLRVVCVFIIYFPDTWHSLQKEKRQFSSPFISSTETNEWNIKEEIETDSTEKVTQSQNWANKQKE